MIPQEAIDKILEVAAIEDVVGKVLPLKKSGIDSYVGNCPFHAERTGSFHVTPSKGLAFCLAGETEVLTRDGRRPIRELAGKTAEIVNGAGEWQSARFYAHGRQKLFRIDLSRNGQKKTIRATAEHGWKMHRRGKGRAFGDGEALTSDLVPGDTFGAVFPPRKEIQIDGDAIRAGIVFGDGSAAYGEKSRLVIYAESEKQDLAKWFPGARATKRGIEVADLPGEWKELPTDAGSRYAVSWLAGLFATDGCVSSRDGTFILVQKDERVIDLARNICDRAGILYQGKNEAIQDKTLGKYHYPDHATFHLRIIPESVPEWFLIREKHLRNYSKKSFRRMRWSVLSVEEDVVEEVFCPIVPGTHSFALADYIHSKNCFGCGWGGNAVRFVMDFSAITFPEAMRELGSTYGIEIPIVETAEERRLRLERKEREHHLSAVQEVFVLRQAEAIAYLVSRGFSDISLLEEWGVGIGDSSPRVDAFRESPDDRIGPARRFSRRLTFPIRDHAGKLLGWSGRALGDEKAKYVNSPGSAHFHKGKILFGLNHALRAILREEEAILVEGQIDVLAMHAAGKINTVAPLGTAFGADHAALLARYTSTVTLALDSDVAGRKAASKIFRILARFGFHVKILPLPEGKDPGDLFATAPELLAAPPVGYLDHLASRLPEDPGVLSKYVKGLGELVGSISDPVIRTATSQQIARRIGIERLELVIPRAAQSSGPKTFPYPVELALAEHGEIPRGIPGDEGEFLHLVAERGLNLATVKDPRFAYALLSRDERPLPVLRTEAKINALLRELEEASSWEDLDEIAKKVAALIKAT